MSVLQNYNFTRYSRNITYIYMYIFERIAYLVIEDKAVSVNQVE